MNLVIARRATRARSARRSSASSAARPARPRSWPTSSSWSTRRRRSSTPLVESLQAVVWHALVSHPGARRRGRASGRPSKRVAVSRARRLPRPRRRDQRARAGRRRTGPRVAAIDPRTSGSSPGAVARRSATRAAPATCSSVVTNQPAAAKGTATRRATLRAVHDARARAARRRGRRSSTAGATASTTPTASSPELTGPCDCRKPAPGMLLDAAAELGLDLAGELDGRRLGRRRRGRARRAGTRTVLVEHPGLGAPPRAAVRRPTRACATSPRRADCDPGSVR